VRLMKGVGGLVTQEKKLPPALQQALGELAGARGG
jgi:hypothetical protein